MILRKEIKMDNLKPPIKPRSTSFGMNKNGLPPYPNPDITNNIEYARSSELIIKNKSKKDNDEIEDGDENDNDDDDDDEEEDLSKSKVFFVKALLLIKKKTPKILKMVVILILFTKTIFINNFQF